MSVPLSVLVLTKNEERNIGACLESVAGWAADIVVVDSGSEDRTLAICAEHGVRTVYHAYADHRSQITWGMTEVRWQHEWLLLLDADNVVTPEFKRDIEGMLRQDDPAVHGYYNPHHHYFRNRRVRGLKPEWLRLVRRSHVKVDDSELVDFRLVVNGTIGRLPGADHRKQRQRAEHRFLDRQAPEVRAAHGDRGDPALGEGAGVVIAPPADAPRQP